MIEFISQLPTEYQEVEYIQSSGTQYIDTGFVPNNNTEIMLVFTNTNDTTGNYYCIFGTRTTANNDNTFALWIDTNRRFGAFYVAEGIGQSLTLFPTSINVTEKHTATMKGRVAEIDSVSVTCPATSSSPAYSFYIGACNTAGTADYFSKILIYESKIYNNEILVRDFVPCYRKADNVAGLYDLVTGTFFTNAGSGTFAVGSNSNKRGEWVITAGGIIPMQWALRRRMMMTALGSGIADLSITYTGDYTDYGMVTMSDGARYRLLAFTSSGTLSIEQPVNCEVCVVGGGANGKEAELYNGGYGGAGAYLKNQSVSAYNGGSVVVGARQGVSSIADVSVNAVSGKNGGTGAGGQTGGTGDGISKYPFEDTGYSLWAGKPHCAGGGQGVDEWSRQTVDRRVGYPGGNGGTNGGNGYPRASSWTSFPSGGVGGSYGGGNGGSYGAINQMNGGNATYYGSGAGGGRCYEDPDGAYEYYNGGSGYQGIVYMRIPEDQAV